MSKGLNEIDRNKRFSQTSSFLQLYPLVFFIAFSIVSLPLKINFLFFENYLNLFENSISLKDIVFHCSFPTTSSNFSTIISISNTREQIQINMSDTRKFCFNTPFLQSVKRKYYMKLQKIVKLQSISFGFVIVVFPKNILLRLYHPIVQDQIYHLYLSWDDFTIVIVKPFFINTILFKYLISVSPFIFLTLFSFPKFFSLQLSLFFFLSGGVWIHYSFSISYSSFFSSMYIVLIQ